MNNLIHFDSLRKKENLLSFIFSFFLTLTSAALVIKNDFPSSIISHLPIDVSFLYFLSFIFFILILIFVFWIIDSPQKKSVISRLLMIYLPAGIIFGLELIFETKLHFAIYILTEFYAVILGFYMISLRNFQWNETAKEKTSIYKKIKNYLSLQGKMAVIIMLLVFIFNFSFSAYRVSDFASVDEPLWLFGRISAYWDGWREQSWNKTFVSDKPGITVSMLAGAGLLKIDPSSYEPINWEGQIYKPSRNIEDIYFPFRFPIVIFAALSLFLFYFFLSQLFTKEQTIVSFIFLGLSPILIGMNRLINPDSLLWIFTSLSIISYFIYLKDRKYSFLYFTGVFLGLALLTKYVANILFIFFLGIMFLEYMFRKKEYAAIGINGYFRQTIIDYCILTFTALTIFTLLCPAVWIQPTLLLSATVMSQAFHPVWHAFAAVMGLIIIDTFFLKNIILSPILNFLQNKKRLFAISFFSVFILATVAIFTNTYLGMKWIDFLDIMASPKSGSKYKIFSLDAIKIFISNFFPLLFGISPLALLAVLLGSGTTFIKKNSREDFWIPLYLVIFIFLYYLGSAVTGVTSTIRYQIILYPIILIVAGFFLGQGMEFLKTKNKRLIPFSYAIIFIICLYPLIKLQPLYAGYASSLLPQKYFLDIKDMGTGSYEAAQFLNSLPAAQNLIIWTDKTGVCYFFKGSCYTGFTISKTIRPDYVVVTSGREHRTTKMSRPKKFNTLDYSVFYDKNIPTVFKLDIDNRPGQFIKIIDLKNVK